MQETLVERIAPNLRRLNEGGYTKIHRRGTADYQNDLQAAFAAILDALHVKHREGIRLPGTSLKADFEANGVLFFVDQVLSERELNQIRKTNRECVLVKRESFRSGKADAGIRVIGMSSGRSGREQTIFLDDPSFNFDYAHILPHTQKCSVMHGHTSSALVEIIGEPIDGMVVDFGPAKDAIREAIRGLDHKLFINSKYVKSEDRKSVTLEFTTVHGDFAIKAPRATTVLLDGEATVENLSRVLLERIAPAMPENVSAVGVYVYEGLNKGSHLLAQLHSGGAGRARRKR
ncbi:MAG TPA: 6-carboxytetrahydropterin synthase [Nitrososphaerales archaeon]|nr:6-carboxytetrahydropterin synthase [Nitrososphaerales archaeon]